MTMQVDESILLFAPNEPGDMTYSAESIVV